MPSGHLMTGTAALQIIVGNYPEKKWIRPVGFSLLTLLSFQMVQSSEHWYSDYPVSLVIGDIIGKNIIKRTVTKISGTPFTEKKYFFNFTAAQRFGNNMIGTNVTF